MDENTLSNFKGVNYNIIYNLETYKDINPSEYMFCTFEECNFNNCDQNKIKELFKYNTLKDCIYDPTLMFTSLLQSLHQNINFVDAINKALIANANKKNKINNKQLVLLDLE